MADRDPRREPPEAALERARQESEDAYADVYAIGPAIYCGMCDQPVNDCTCFEEIDNG